MPLLRQQEIKKFTNENDLKNKKIEMDVKPLENIYKDRLSFELVYGENKSEQEVIYFNQDFIVNGSYDNKTYNAQKYSVEIEEDGWYHVTLFVAKTWSLESYVTDYLNIGFANKDAALDATCLIANVNMSNYDIFASDIPDVPAEKEYYDYSDDLHNSYAASVAVDKEIHHDGEQSMKCIGSDVDSTTDTAGVQTYFKQSMAGKKLAWYVKFDGETVRKNRLATTVYSDSSTKIGTYNISLQDSLASGITMSAADANGWHYIEMDMDTLGLNTTDIHKVRFVISSPDKGVTIPVCWIDELYVMDK